MLWIALHLPLLSLESFEATVMAASANGDDEAGAAQGRVTPSGAPIAPIALIDAHHIVNANAAALALGVKPGIKRATALALAPHITLAQADARRDGQALTGVVHAALAFTPSVTLEAPDEPNEASRTVLLEVAASLRYFGGFDGLLRRLKATVAPLGHTVQCASAPTAKGAAWLARMPEAAAGVHAPDLRVLNRQLDRVPLWLAGPGREHWEALQGMGLRQLSDLKGLPRSGLARRFGEALLDDIDRARGIRPDPREWQVAPESFDGRLELCARADTTEQVMQGASLLLPRMLAWAAARHALPSRFTLHMKHEARHRREAETPAESLLEISLAEPSRDLGHWMVLLRERLAQQQLAAPTLELQLTCCDVVQREPPNSELFPTARSEREGLTRLIERLQARLGRERVQRLKPVEDPRPEHATQAIALDPGQGVVLPRATVRSAGTATGPERPVWVLPRPEPLAERQLRPLLDGRPLRLLCGPERVESGWWDAGLAERDYFIAQASDGALVWIYRARLPQAAVQPGAAWFLQGRFG